MAGTTFHDDEGASPKELLLEAARRDNLDLLKDVLGFKVVDADFLNRSTDGVGNTALHMAAQYGSFEALDHLLDQEGLEVDPINLMEKETPLHKAVQYANKEKQVGAYIVEMLIDAGADPRIRNKQRQRPIDIVDPRDTKLKGFLQKAEYAMTIGNDLADDDDNGGPQSDSD